MVSSDKALVEFEMDQASGSLHPNLFEIEKEKKPRTCQCLHTHDCELEMS